VGNAGAQSAARVDHAAAAGNVGIELAPNQVLIFGNPKIGSQGKTVVACHNPASLALSFGLSPEMNSFTMMAGALSKLTDTAISE